MQKPSLGQIVHYRAPGDKGAVGNVSAAIITCVFSDNCVNLAIFKDGGPMDGDTSVPLYEEDPGEWGCWWPPRV